MRRCDSSRSSSDSAAAISAGESSPPQGLLAGCDSRHQRSKSMAPLFSTSVPPSS